MNKIAALLAAGMLLSGCVYNSKVSTRAEQLQHHRFVLTSVNGQPLKA
ncbi:TPA: heat-inducible protein, partial [Klebsiella oxytoca]|nr:heat-inducible protein [Klebsiella oxytoca]